jgi:hypothetical protein
MAGLNERLTNLYAAQDDLVNLGRNEEVSRGAGFMRSNMGTSMLGKLESAAGRALPGQVPCSSRFVVMFGHVPSTGPAVSVGFFVSGLRVLRLRLRRRPPAYEPARPDSKTVQIAELTDWRGKTLRRCFDCYRVERTSSRAGIPPLWISAFSRRTPITRPIADCKLWKLSSRAASLSYFTRRNRNCGSVLVCSSLLAHNTAQQGGRNDAIAGSSTRYLCLWSRYIPTLESNENNCKGCAGANTAASVC